MPSAAANCRSMTSSNLRMEAPSSYFMKSPPVQYFDDDARTATEQFIATYGQKATGKALKAAAKRPAMKKVAKKTATKKK